jgi:hypothetical protein
MHHHRSDYDFDVISGPATTRSPAPPAVPLPPAGSSRPTGAGTPAAPRPTAEGKGGE